MMNRIITAVGTYLYLTLNPRVATRLAFSPLGKAVFYAMNGFSNKPKIYNTSDNIKLLLTPKEALGLGVFHIGTVNKLESDLMRRVVKDGDVVVDIGTYIDSWHTLLAAKLVGKKGKVYAFEPHPRYYKRLQDNVKRNRFSNVLTYKMGVYDKIGTYTFFDAEGASSLNAENAQRHIGSKPKSTFKVKTTTLNSFVRKEKIKCIDFIKIDAEGVEMNILRKSNEILRKYTPDLIVEVEDVYLKHTGSDEKTLLQYLGTYGYNAYEFTPGGIIPFIPGHERMLLNLFFTKKNNFHKVYNEI